MVETGRGEARFPGGSQRHGPYSKLSSASPSAMARIGVAGR
jgi:hypothetical protein